jgi:hypothetical protein
MVRFLELIRPAMCVLPEVATPDRKIPFREKALWTIIDYCALHLLGVLPDPTILDVCQGEREPPVHRPAELAKIN